jgi:dipeptidyl aminopeptidase/acylaminoacyl peptidase
VEMWLLYPPGKDRKNLPLVHLIHGGPHGTFGDQWHWRWSAQAFAARGYLVAMVNFHGSTGWGNEFARCIMGEWGKRPFDDIMRGTDYLIEHGLADPQRLACAGGSYGGYMVSWIASQTDRFKCLVNHAGVSDLQAQYARDVTPGREKGPGRRALGRPSRSGPLQPDPPQQGF